MRCRQPLALFLGLGLTACLPDLQEDTSGKPPLDDTQPDTHDTQPPPGDQDRDGWAVGEGDCDDGDASIYPGAPDVVGDGVDQSCDGIDGIDNDGDGFASEASGGDDCNDDDGGINPTGFDWNDDADNDCDGTIDTISTALADGRWVGQMSAAGVGASIASAGDVNNDGLDDLLVGAVGDPDAGGRGAAYLLLGPADQQQDVLAADARLLGAANVDGGWPAVSGAGDSNHDGYADMLVGAAGTGSGANDAGEVYLVRGPLSGDLYFVGAHATLSGLTANDMVGASVAQAGDVDGDASADFLVGSPGWGTSFAGRGAAYLITEPPSGESSIETAGVRLYGESINDTAGWAVSSAGDTNGDGLNDLIIGAPYESSLRSQNGAAYVVMGPCTASGNLGTLGTKLQGPSDDSQAGYAVASAGDFNGDGLGDVIIGARSDDTGGSASGTAFVVFGPFIEGYSLDNADLRATGEDRQDFAGTSVAGAGDIDGDGKDDVLVGAPGHDFSGESDGAVYLLLGNQTGTMGLNTAQASFMGEQVGQQAGSSVTGAGDLNGDGATDLAFGAWYYQGDGVTNGTAYVFHGPGDGS